MQNLKQYKLPKSWVGKYHFFKIITWRIVGLPLLSSFIPGTIWRKILLMIFGSKIGKGGRIKPYVKVTYPWKLKIGHHCWIGEEVWIDNLDHVKIGDNVCLSQKTYLCTGNHNYKSLNFDLITKTITIENGSWIGACCIILPGSLIGSNSVVSMGSLFKGIAKKNSIYGGNPAEFLRERKFN